VGVVTVDVVEMVDEDDVVESRLPPAPWRRGRTGLVEEVMEPVRAIVVVEADELTREVEEL